MKTIGMIGGETSILNDEVKAVGLHDSIHLEESFNDDTERVRALRQKHLRSIYKETESLQESLRLSEERVRALEAAAQNREVDGKSTEALQENLSLCEEKIKALEATIATKDTNLPLAISVRHV